MHENLPYLQEVLLFLGAAIVLVPLLKRLNINPVLGFLIVGIMIGPDGVYKLFPDNTLFSAFMITDYDHAKPFAELGVVFLLFAIGLEVSFERLWSMRRLIFGLGVLQVVITGTVIGSIAWLWGNSGVASLLIGTSLALSSTAVVVKLLSDHHDFATPAGQTAFSILLLQDLAVVPLLIFVSALSAPISEGAALTSVFLSFGKAVVMIFLIGILGRLILRPIYRFVAQAHSAELFTALTLFVVIGTSALTGNAGMSAALGAFLAGAILAETEYRHQIESDIEPFKGLFLGLFFMFVGMGINVAAIVELFGWVIASVLGLFVIKASILVGLSLMFRLSLPLSAQTGIMLAQAGEFVFVVLGLAFAAELVEPTAYHFLLMVVSLSILLSPLQYMLGRYVAFKLSARHEGQYVNNSFAGDGHVVIAGFGRVGKMVARFLKSQNIPFVGIDYNSDLPNGLRKEGVPVFFGDASKANVLRQLNTGNAKILIVAMNEPRASLQTVICARELFPKLKIYARAADSSHAKNLKLAGADRVVLETEELSLQLTNQLFQDFDIPIEEIDTYLQSIREETS